MDDPIAVTARPLARGTPMPGSAGAMWAIVRSPTGAVVLVPFMLVRAEVRRLRRVGVGDTDQPRADHALARIAQRMRPELWPD